MAPKLLLPIEEQQDSSNLNQSSLGVLDLADQPVEARGHSTARLSQSLAGRSQQPLAGRDSRLAV